MLPDGVSRKALRDCASITKTAKCRVSHLLPPVSSGACRAVIRTLALTKALRRIVLQP